MPEAGRLFSETLGFDWTNILYDKYMLDCWFNISIAIDSRIQAMFTIVGLPYPCDNNQNPTDSNERDMAGG
jgi:hypothetical protein